MGLNQFQFSPGNDLANKLLDAYEDAHSRKEFKTRSSFWAYLAEIGLEEYLKRKLSGITQNGSSIVSEPEAAYVPESDLKVMAEKVFREIATEQLPGLITKLLSDTQGNPEENAV